MTSQRPPTQTDGEQRAIEVARGAALDLSGYQKERYNVLSPVLRTDTSSELLRYRIMEMRLDADHESGDVYPAPGSKWRRQGDRLVPETVALAKTGLLKIASAAGLVIDPDRTGRIRPESCDRCLEAARATGVAAKCAECPGRWDTAYRIVGAVRDGTGWRTLTATYEWSLDAERRRIKRDARKRLASYEKNLREFEAGRRNKAPAPFDFDSYVRDRVDQKITERHALAESKALLRLVRAICMVRHTYRAEQAAKPFVAVRVDLEPDMSNPEIQKLLAERALAANTSLFGAPPPPQSRTVEAQIIDRPDFAAAEEAPPLADPDEPDDAANGSAPPVGDPPPEQGAEPAPLRTGPPPGERPGRHDGLSQADLWDPVAEGDEGGDE
jgi:hypothetical protein